ncbi:21277_t:CDS:1 [Dentiscutata erythropus]|uniref:21277_t:CDS:1 n=1 Tax=Dentiscutata erythropus TaxID=1348616 RepID=A0A9N9JJQ3_9GLOM|nr:21277_t:CDS:1 [Dentiscutata erythropus]
MSSEKNFEDIVKKVIDLYRDDQLESAYLLAKENIEKIPSNHIFYDSIIFYFSLTILKLKKDEEIAKVYEYKDYFEMSSKYSKTKEKRNITNKFFCELFDEISHYESERSESLIFDTEHAFDEEKQDTKILANEIENELSERLFSSIEQI